MTDGGGQPPADRPTPASRATPRFDRRTALLSVPGVPLILVFGQLSGDMTSALIAAGAAFTVAFGAARTIAHSHWYVMIDAGVGITLAAFAGTLAGDSFWSSALLVVGLAAASALTVSRDQNLWWVSLQVFGAATVAASFPNGMAGALDRAELVAAGSLVQILCGVALGAVFPRLLLDPPSARNSLPSPAGTTTAYVLSATVAVVLSSVLVAAFGLQHGYWAPMTALFVLKQNRHDTWHRGLQRVVGTLAGILLADAFVALVGADSPLPAIAAITVASGLAYGLQNAGYASLSAAIAFTIVLMIGLIDQTVVANGEQRLAATVVGGLIAVGCSAGQSAIGKALRLIPVPSRKI